jgi:peptidyl-prolyl cis-trans isomerase C
MIRATAVLALLATVACSRGATTPEQKAPEAAASQPAPMPSSAVAPPGGEVKPVPAELPAVVANVNGESIGKAEFENAVRSVEGRAGQPVPPDQRDRIYRQILDDLIRYKLLLQESRARKVAVPESEIDARIASIRGQYPNDEAFNGMLKQQNLTINQVRADMRDDIGVSNLLGAEVEPKVKVTPEEVSAFFKQNPENFQVPERVRASHVLITVPEGADASAKSAALAKANTVLKDARAGKDFAELAKTHSQDPGSAPRGGDLGFFQPGDMVGPFNEVAFRLAPGAISDVVETQFGYHVIKVLEKQPGRTVPLEEARPRIEEYLRNASRDKFTQEFVQSLRSKGKVDVFI